MMQQKQRYCIFTNEKDETRWRRIKGTASLQMKGMIQDAAKQIFRKQNVNHLKSSSQISQVFAIANALAYS